MFSENSRYTNRGKPFTHLTQCFQLSSRVSIRSSFPSRPDLGSEGPRNRPLAEVSYTTLIRAGPRTRRTPGYRGERRRSLGSKSSDPDRLQGTEDSGVAGFRF